jgi:hypothetical protein
VNGKMTVYTKKKFENTLKKIIEKEGFIAGHVTAVSQSLGSGSMTTIHVSLDISFNGAVLNVPDYLTEKKA